MSKVQLHRQNVKSTNVTATFRGMWLQVVLTATPRAADLLLKMFEKRGLQIFGSNNSDDVGRRIQKIR
jgi:hypothetical protein